jgi:hypothetical protein
MLMRPHIKNWSVSGLSRAAPARLLNPLHKATRNPGAVRHSGLNMSTDLKVEYEYEGMPR